MYLSGASLLCFTSSKLCSLAMSGLYDSFYFFESKDITLELEKRKKSMISLVSNPTCGKYIYIVEHLTTHSIGVWMNGENETTMIDLSPNFQLTTCFHHETEYSLFSYTNKSFFHSRCTLHSNYMSSKCINALTTRCYCQIFGWKYFYKSFHLLNMKHQNRNDLFYRKTIIYLFINFSVILFSSGLS